MVHPSNDQKIIKLNFLEPRLKIFFSVSRWNSTQHTMQNINKPKCTVACRQKILFHSVIVELRILFLIIIVVVLKRTVLHDVDVNYAFMPWATSFDATKKADRKKSKRLCQRRKKAVPENTFTTTETFTKSTGRSRPRVFTRWENVSRTSDFQMKFITFQNNLNQRRTWGRSQRRTLRLLQRPTQLDLFAHVPPENTNLTRC